MQISHNCCFLISLLKPLFYWISLHLILQISVAFSEILTGHLLWNVFISAMHLQYSKLEYGFIHIKDNDRIMLIFGVWWGIYLWWKSTCGSLLLKYKLKVRRTDLRALCTADISEMHNFSQPDVPASNEILSSTFWWKRLNKPTQEAILVETCSK